MADDSGVGMGFAAAAIARGWKTSANGILAFLIATGGVLLATAPELLGKRTTVAMTLGLALCRTWIGLIQTDAGTVLARTPKGDAKAVPSHEVPDDPANEAKP